MSIMRNIHTAFGVLGGPHAKTVALQEGGNVMRQRSILGICVIASLVSILTGGCGNKAGGSISVSGEASRETYVSMMGGGLGDVGVPLAYHVAVTLKNSGTTNVTFDEIQGAFVPFQGQPLIQRTFAYDRSKGESVGAYEKGGNSLNVLEPGKSLDFDYTTDGYTMELLAAAGEQPLQFHLVLFRGGSPVAGPFVADLPNLADLPQYELTSKGDRKSRPLSFTPHSGN